MSYIQHCITQDINSNLAREFTKDEILEAFNQMDPCKALEIDGLLGSFFKNNWEIVGKKLLLFYLDVLKGNKDISRLKYKMIILIPKIKITKSFPNFLLIDSRQPFCVVSVKTKVISSQTK